MPIVAATSERWYRNCQLALFGWIALVGLALRWSMLLVPYWFDEVNTIHYVTQPFGRMLQFVLHDIETPAYYVALKGWLALVPENHATSGIFSLLLEIPVLVLLYQLARRLASRAVARFTVAFYWVSYIGIYYSTETRPYPLVLAAALASTIALYELLHHGGNRRWWLCYVASAALGVYTHYSFLFILYAQNVLVAWYAGRKRVRLDFRHWVAFQGVIVAACLPLLPAFLDRFGGWANRTAQTWTDMESIQSAGQFLEKTVLAQLLPSNAYSEMTTIVGAVVALAVISAAVEIRREGHRFHLSRRSLTMAEWFPIVLGAAPLLLLWLSGFALMRYVILAGPMVCLLLAVWVVRWRAWWPRLLIFSGVAAVMVVANVTYAVHYPQREIRYSWPQVAAALQREQPGDGRGLIILTDWDAERQFKYYYRGAIPAVRFFPSSLVVDSDAEVSQIRKIGTATIDAGNVEEIAGLVQGHNPIWLVVGDAAFIYDPDAEAQGWMNGHCFLEYEASFFAPEVPGWKIYVLRYRDCVVSSVP